MLKHGTRAWFNVEIIDLSIAFSCHSFVVPPNCPHLTFAPPPPACTAQTKVLAISDTPDNVYGKSPFFDGSLAKKEGDESGDAELEVSCAVLSPSSVKFIFCPIPR